MKKKKAFILVLILNVVLILAYFYVIKSDQRLDKSTDVTSSSHTSEKELKQSAQIVTTNKNESIDYCKQVLLENNFLELEKVSTLLWRNTHIEMNSGTVFRVRYFYDDGPNGQYKKTIIYKENDEGFPLIHMKENGFSDKEELKLLKSGRVIWEERAFNSSEDLYWRIVNNKIVEFKLKNQKKCEL